MVRKAARPPDREAGSRSLTELTDDYLLDCRARGLRSKTVEQAGWVIRQVFLAWCEREGVTDAPALTGQLVNRWTISLHEAGGPKGRLAAGSIRAYVVIVNRWLRWMHRRGEAESLEAHKPRLPKRVVDILTPAEVERMEDAARTTRDKLLIACLWQTGCRASELLRLRTDDLVESGRHRFLRLLSSDLGGGAKGDRERLVPVPRLYPSLRRYADRERPNALSDRLWLALRRSPSGEFEPLELSGLEQLVRGLAKDAGIRKRVHPHLFRHSAVTHWLRRGMSPLQVANIVGHSSLTMIQQVYAHLDSEDAYAALAKVLGS